MRINATNSAPNLEPAIPVSKAHKAPAAAHDTLDQRPIDNHSTDVVVEMQPGNVLVYKIIDQSSGQVIQQIPARQVMTAADVEQFHKKR